MFSGEITVLQWLEQLRTPFWTRFWETITLLGEDTVFIFVIAFLYFLWSKKTAHRIAFLAVASLGINGILKNTFRIPRPFAEGKVSCVRPESATGYSFPSGHTQNFTTWSVALADRAEQKKWMWLALFLSVMVGVSRMFLGAHYFSDVAASLCLGVGISLVGNRILDQLSNQNRAYTAMFLLFTPFFIWFLCFPDPLFEDFFKCYGMLGGFLLAVRLEEAYGQFREDVSVLRRMLRMLVGVGLAFGLKTLLSAISFSGLHFSLVWDSCRYFLLVLVIFGGYPVILNKCNW
ncbi:MAG: phosphatase PAP2 family protein [Clostridia bacterium]|nr:phosphatase PAP2 family protein [Clostridia bacterium]